MICLFLALLELVKYQAITLQQGELFGEIDIAKEQPLDEVMQGDKVLENLQEEYK